LNKNSINISTFLDLFLTGIRKPQSSTLSPANDFYGLDSFLVRKQDIAAISSVKEKFEGFYLDGCNLVEVLCIWNTKTAHAMLMSPFLKMPLKSPPSPVTVVAAYLAFEFLRNILVRHHLNRENISWLRDFILPLIYDLHYLCKITSHHLKAAGRQGISYLAQAERKEKCL